MTVKTFQILQNKWYIYTNIFFWTYPFIKESWKKMHHAFHKNVKQHNWCFLRILEWFLIGFWKFSFTIIDINLFFKIHLNRKQLIWIVTELHTITLFEQYKLLNGSVCYIMHTIIKIFRIRFFIAPLFNYFLLNITFTFSNVIIVNIKQVL